MLILFLIKLFKNKYGYALQHNPFDFPVSKHPNISPHPPTIAFKKAAIDNRSRANEFFQYVFPLIL